MADRRIGWILAWAVPVVIMAMPQSTRAQGPTIEESALITSNHDHDDCRAR